MPLLTGDAKPVDRTFYWRMDRTIRKQKAIRHGKWKYVNDANTMDLLFDLEADISEHTNLGYQHPEILTDLKARLKTWEAEMDASDREIWVK